MADAGTGGSGTGLSRAHRRPREPVMTVPTLEVRPTHKALPLLRSEISRITHRRLYRVLGLLFIAAITVISLIVFFAHDNEVGGNHPYKAYEAIPVGLIGTAIAAAGVAFLVGASSGG